VIAEPRPVRPARKPRARKRPPGMTPPTPPQLPHIFPGPDEVRRPDEDDVA
jgi:hypothetical protein